MGQHRRKLLLGLKSVKYLLGVVLLWPLIHATPLLGDETQSALALDQQVQAIFESRCVMCHGPQLKRPKGKFGYVTDLNRLAANSDYIVPFEPSQSLLYELVLNNEMPEIDSEIPPLTTQQKQIIHTWIQSGAVVTLTDSPGANHPSTPVKQDPAAGQSEQKQTRPGILPRAANWIGRFHPGSTHLPIGLLVAAALAELLMILPLRIDLRSTARFCLAVGAIAAVATALLGWLNAESPMYAQPRSWELWLHRWLGIVTAGAANITMVLSEWHARRPGPKIQLAYRVALFTVVALINVVGFLGGVNVYGLDHYRL